MKDFFISYNQADRQWAEWIAWQLEEAGYTTVIQAWDFRPGGNFVVDMQRAAVEAKRTIAVLSPDYLASRFTQPEWAAAFAQDPTGENGLLLPVRVRECDLKGLLPQIVYIDFVGINDEDAARDALLNGVKRERAKPDIAPSFPPSASVKRSVIKRPRFPGALPDIRNITHQRNPNFVGRDTLLDQIRKTLTAEKAAALTAIHGLGGVGKTQLATEYAFRHAADYQIVWWIKSEETATLAADYAALAEKLDLPQKHEREQPVIVAAVREWLNHNAGWLLIFDNARQAQDVRDYLPQSRAGHVLITSRDPNWSRVAHPFEVKVLPREDSVKFLLQRTGKNDEAAARALADDLGDLPLALEQAGAYIEATGESLADYRQMFQISWQALMQEGKPDDYPDTVAVTWKLSFDKAQAESPASAELMHLCAFLAPDDIPLPILRDGTKHLPPVLAEAMAEKLAFNKAIAALRRYSLMERNDDRLSVHRLVQAVERDWLPEDERRKWAEAAVCVVNDAFPLGSEDVQTWSVCARLLPHAETVAEYGERLQLAPEATGQLLNQAGIYFCGLGQYAEAKQALERALRIDETAFGPDHPNVLREIANLSGVLKALGDLQGAYQYCKRALQIAIAAFDFNHPKVAICYNNMGLVLQDLRDFQGAHRCFEHALRIDEAAFGLDHPEVAKDTNNMGLVLQDLRDFQGARQCFERALRINEAAFGPVHPGVTSVVNNLGLLLQDLRDFQGARQCFERVLQADKVIFGSDHPNVARGDYNLGRVLLDLNDRTQAHQCFERALQIFHKLLGEDHPNTVRVRNYLESLK